MISYKECLWAAIIGLRRGGKEQWYDGRER